MKSQQGFARFPVSNPRGGRTTCRPPASTRHKSSVYRAGSTPAGTKCPTADSRLATPGFFETLRIRPIEGRVFQERDRLHSTRLLVINKAMARRYWPQESALGKQIILPQRRQEVLAEIIGVVENVRTHALTESPPDVMYMNSEQNRLLPIQSNHAAHIGGTAFANPGSEERHPRN